MSYNKNFCHCEERLATCLPDEVLSAGRRGNPVGPDESTSRLDYHVVPDGLLAMTKVEITFLSNSVSPSQQLLPSLDPIRDSRDPLLSFFQRSLPARFLESGGQ